MESSENHHNMKFKRMFETILSSLFMLPFIVRNPLLIEEINRKLQKNDFKDKRQLLHDLTTLIGFDEKQIMLTMDTWLQNYTEKRQIVFQEEDINRCFVEIEKKISSIALTISFEEQLERNPLSGKIFTALKGRFPNVDEETLKSKILFQSMSNNEEGWKRVVKILSQENKNNNPGAVFKQYSFFPSWQSELQSKNLVHQHIAAFHFYRMLAKWTDKNGIIPVPLRKVHIIVFLNFLDLLFIFPGEQPSRCNFEFQHHQVPSAGGGFC